MQVLPQKEVDRIINDFNSKVKSLFGNLTFVGKSHEYFIGGEKLPISVSGVVKSFVPVTNWDKIAAAIAKRDHTTKEAVLRGWREKNRIACDNGTKTHDFAEALTPQSKAEVEKEQAVIEFWAKLYAQERYILITKELRMYHKVLHYSGTCDFILYDTWTKTFIIGDYKTNEDLFKNYKEQTLLEPFEFLLDCPYNHYQIQLSLYQILLEQIENIIISERWIVYLQADSDYKIHKCYNFSDHLRSHLSETKYQITKLEPCLLG